MPRRIITLTTDFGTGDYFVGAVKGVILGIAPDVDIVDITHHVRAFEITEGAFVIAQAYPYFPKRTIHVVVIDPGVGTARRPILVEAAGQFFIGPDNGVLAMVYGREKKHKVREISAAGFFRQPLSRTFHGRDLFAPVAAHLAKGITPAQLGKPIDDYLRVSFEHPPRTGKRAWSGTVLKVDHFGNLITNFHIDEFAEIQSRPFELVVGIQKVHRLALNYADGDDGALFAIVGSSGYVEVAGNQTSAARVLGCGAGAPVELTLY